MKMTMVGMGVAAICGCAVLGIAHGADWTGEVDVSKAKVYVAEDATVPEVEAAKMLMRAQIVLGGGLDPVTNCAAPLVAKAWPTDGIVIGWQGTALVKPLAKELDLKDWFDMPIKGDDVIVQRVKGGVLVLAANSPQGTCYCVGDLLYRNGARFLHNGGDDGNDGTFLEYMTGLKAPKDWRYSPEAVKRTGFQDRQRNGVPKGFGRDAYLIAKNKFAVFNGASGVGPLEGGRAKLDIGGESVQPPVNEFKRHPTWFPEIDGKRWRPTSGGWDWVVEGCWNSAEFADWVITNNENWVRRLGGEDRVLTIGLTTSDGGRKCECAPCKALRAKYPDVSSWYWDYVTKLSARQHALHPRMSVESLAYIDGLRYPKLGKKVLKGLDAVDYCPYGRCFIHPLSDKSCPTNARELDSLNEWTKAELPIGDFDYLFDTFNPPVNMPVWELAADTVDYWKRLNGPRKMPMMYSECAVEGGCGAKSRIAHYVFARKLWQADASADEHLQDWCRCGFGEAGETMLRFFRAEAVAWTNQPVHLSQCFNNPLGTSKTFMTDALEKLGKESFMKAEAILADVAAKGDVRARARVRKQQATLAFEKKVFEEWIALKEKAKKAAMEIALEIGDADAKGFERMRKYPMKTRYPKWQGEDVTGSFVQYYRTKDAIRIRVTSNDALFRKQEWKERRGKDAGFNFATTIGTMELFLQGPGQNGYYHICVAADGTTYDADAKDPTALDSSIWSVESVQRDGFWQLSFTLPWTFFGRDGAKPGEIYKAVVINNAHRKNPKNGETEGFAVGVPFPAYHDIGVGADLVVDDDSHRRPDEGDSK